MTNYFPTDVRVRYDGDKDAGTQYVGAARNLLVRALIRQKAQPGLPVQLIKYLDNGGYISVELIETFKTIIISVPKIVEPEEPEEEDIEPGHAIYVLCGIEKGATTVTVDGKQYLRSYRPTLATSTSHNITNAYHDNERLANTHNPTKAGYYSGAMKRVVAAVEGLGKIRDSSGFYLTPPSAATRTVMNVYQTTATTTHGIYKAANKNHWLIEISALRGVLAMPLPLIPSTRSKSYRSYLVRIGDTGGLAIYDEFGGLPSGETFPSDPAKLTTAITNKKVLRLLTAAELDPYYKAIYGETHTVLWSWAFRDDGGEVHNVRYNYRKITGEPKYSLSGEHWYIRLSLTPHNKAAVLPDPVGTGTATLTMNSEGKMGKYAMKNFWAGGEGENVYTPLSTYTYLNIMDYTLSNTETSFGCAMYVFFNGNRIEIVKYVPGFIWAAYDESIAIPTGEYSTGGCIGEGYAAIGRTGSIYSPEAIISSNIDLRRLNVSQISWEDVLLGAHPEPTVGSVFAYRDLFDPEVTICIPNPNLSISLAAMTFFHGFGGYDDELSNQFYQYFAIIPGYCREGVVLNRLGTTSTDTEHHGAYSVGYFDKIGTYFFGYERNFTALPQPGMIYFFAAVINPGPNLAYIMTRKPVMPSSFTGGPPVSPGYIEYNLLNDPTHGTSTTQTITFIGSY